MRDHRDGVDEVKGPKTHAIELRLRVDGKNPELGAAEIDSFLDHVADEDPLPRHALSEKSDHAAVAAAKIEPPVDIVGCLLGGSEAFFDQGDDIPCALRIRRDLLWRAVQEHEIVEVDPAGYPRESTRGDQATDRRARRPRCSVNAAMPLDRARDALRHGGYHSASE